MHLIKVFISSLIITTNIILAVGRLLNPTIITITLIFSQGDSISIKLNISLIMTESIVCRTERANPAQSIALKSKGFGSFCAQKLRMLTNFLTEFISKMYFIVTYLLT